MESCEEFRKGESRKAYFDWDTYEVKYVRRAQPARNISYSAPAYLTLRAACKSSTKDAKEDWKHRLVGKYTSTCLVTSAVSAFLGLDIITPYPAPGAFRSYVCSNPLCRLPNKVSSLVEHVNHRNHVPIALHLEKAKRWDNIETNVSVTKKRLEKSNFLLYSTEFHCSESF